MCSLLLILWMKNGNTYLVLKQIIDANITSLKMESYDIEYARQAFKKACLDKPLPQIPIKDHDTTFNYPHVELVRYVSTGAKVHIDSFISCYNKNYNVSCNVRWTSCNVRRKGNNSYGVFKNATILETLFAISTEIT